MPKLIEITLDPSNSKSLNLSIFGCDTENQVKISVDLDKRIKLSSDGHWKSIDVDDFTIINAVNYISNNQQDKLVTLVESVKYSNNNFWIQTNDSHPWDITVPESYAHFRNVLNTDEIIETKFAAHLDCEDIYEIRYKNGTYRYFRFSDYEGFILVSIGSKVFNNQKPINCNDNICKISKELGVWYEPRFGENVEETIDNTDAKREFYWDFDINTEEEFESIGVRYIVLNRLLKMNYDVDKEFNYDIKDTLK